MRPVSGFERPALQWGFVAVGLLLIVIAGWEAVGLRRARSTIQALRTSDLNARAERQRLELRVSQEQSARESFALEAARLRGTLAAGAPEPTLTLAPATLAHPAPPEPTVAALSPGQVVLLRLTLAGRKSDPAERYEIAIRSWSGGAILWSRSDLRAAFLDGRSSVLARVTGDVLAPGAYEIVLKETAPDGTTRDAGAYEVAIGPPSGR